MTDIMGEAINLSELDNTIIEAICEEYLRGNFKIESDEQLKVMTGVFMAGAATYFDISGCLVSSELPPKHVVDMVHTISMKSIELAHGKLIKMSCEAMQMPKAEEVH
jgi:hypothetical protein